MSKSENKCSTSSKYILLTAAHNEEAVIAETISSVLEQNHLPISWIIVSDGSTDTTDSIVKSFAIDYPFIRFIRKEKDSFHKGFGSKVHALQIAYAAARSEVFEFIGHLDADIRLNPDYVQSLLERFQINPKLGLSGGYIHERSGVKFKSRTTNRQYSVAGALQFFRRQCYEDIGELPPLEFGGEDWYAEIRAKMCGWEVRAFQDLIAYHYKDKLHVSGKLRETFRAGRMDYSLGSHPLFEIAKCLKRATDRPYIITSFSRLIGYCAEYFLSHRPSVPEIVVNFLRREQLQKLRQLSIR